MSAVSGIADHVAYLLWDVSWQVTVLIAVVALASLLFRRAPANFRYGLWCIVLLRLCVPFELSFPAPVNIDMRATAATYSRWLLDPEGAIANPAPRADAPSMPAMPRKTAMMLIWMGVAAAAASLVLAREWQARRLLRKCGPVDREEAESLAYQLRVRCGIRRSVALGVFPDSVQTAGPCVTGILNPCILLPRPMADEWPLAELEPVLLHELAHVKRLDLLVNLVQIAVQIAYFFHPLVWLANWRIRSLREEVCDDMAVLNMQRQKKRYGSSFLRVIEETQREPALALCPAQISEARNSLGRRVVRIMSKDYVYHRKLGVKAFAALAAVAVVAIGAAGISAQSQNIFEESQNLFDEGRHEEAIEVLQQAFENAPGTETAMYAMNKLGLFYMWIKQNEKSVEVLERAVQEFPNRPGVASTWLYLGEAYEKLGRREDAEAAWRQCIHLCEGRVEPDEFPCADAKGELMLTMAEALYQTKEYEQAIEVYTRIYTELPDWRDASHAMMMVGMCYCGMGDDEKALTSLEQTVERYPAVVGWSEATWFYLGNKYEEAGRPEDALTAYQKSVELASQCKARKPDGFPWACAAERIAALQQ